jgi:hypothetical protein
VKLYEGKCTDETPCGLDECPECGEEQFEARICAARAEGIAIGEKRATERLEPVRRYLLAQAYALSEQAGLCRFQCDRPGAVAAEESRNQIMALLSCWGRGDHLASGAGVGEGKR